MLVDQLTICLPDSPGTLAELCRKIGEAGIQIHALAIAHDADFGMFRMICDRPRIAAEVVARVETSTAGDAAISAAVSG